MSTKRASNTNYNINPLYVPISYPTPLNMIKLDKRKMDKIKDKIKNENTHTHIQKRKEKGKMRNQNFLKT